jgi:hypothetical protein
MVDPSSGAVGVVARRPESIFDFRNLTGHLGSAAEIESRYTIRVELSSGAEGLRGSVTADRLLAVARTPRSEREEGTT